LLGRTYGSCPDDEATSRGKASEVLTYWRRKSVSDKAECEVPTASLINELLGAYHRCLSKGEEDIERLVELVSFPPESRQKTVTGSKLAIKLAAREKQQHLWADLAKLPSTRTLEAARLKAAGGPCNDADTISVATGEWMNFGRKDVQMVLKQMDSSEEAKRELD
jgi:hypothetical protein